MMLRAAALAICAVPALAQDMPPTAPEVAPRPEARPDGAAAAGAAAIPDVTPPEDGAAAPVPSEPEAEEQPPEPAEPPVREQLAEPPDELASCLAALDGLDVDYERIDPILDPANPDCGIANPLRVTSIEGVAIEPPAELRCAAALAAAHWIGKSVLPVTARLPERGRLTGLVQGTGYLCRARVGDGTDKLSEHAFGNALDVAAFRFTTGDDMAVAGLAGAGTMEEAFLAAVRGAACLDFTTVLGPGANAEHEDHLHLDVRARDGGFRICQ